ncbi:MAG: MlaD family protein [Puniceicoccales bacterium]|jgi:paraquat-inducible protein B|nr:MlaD family protein [Puniceicoccales bacterium]
MNAFEKKQRDRHSIIGRWIVFFGVILFGVLAVLWWKTSLAPKEHLVLYFRQSINGLTIGSPVKVMGVEVGQVEGLGVYFPDEKSATSLPPDSPQDYYYAVVRVAIENKRLRSRGLPKELDNLKILEAEIERGMRGQLALASPMTGQYYIEISYLPKSPIRRVSPKQGVPEIPTVDRSMTLFIDELSAKVLKFAENDFLAMEREWNATLDEILEETVPENFTKTNHDIINRLTQIQDILNDPSIPEECHAINQKMLSLRNLLEEDGRSLLSKVEDGKHLFMSIQQSFATVNKQATMLETLFQFDSPELRNAHRQLQKFRNIVTGLSTNLHLPSRQAIPNAPINTGLSPAGQSVEF